MHLTAPAQAARRALLQRILALSGVLAVAVLLFLAATSRTQAFSPEILAEKQHFFHCLQLLITDPDAHVRECNPRPILPQLDTLASTSDSTPPPPKQEEPEDECPEHEYETFTSFSSEEGDDCYPS